MRFLCCLLAGWSVLLSGCGESKEEAVDPTRKLDETVTLDADAQTTKESKAPVVVPNKEPNDTVTLDEKAQTTNNLQAAAVAAIKKLGGKVTFDEKNPDNPVVEVDLDLRNSQASDAGLVHLKGLTSLHTLRLISTEVTDAGLVHLKGLTSLTTLNLQGIRVTTAGMQDLQSALPKCRISK
jgi:hypothetical protein